MTCSLQSHPLQSVSERLERPATVINIRLHVGWNDRMVWSGKPCDHSYDGHSDVDAYCRPTVSAYVPCFVSIGLFCRTRARKAPNFAFFGLRHFLELPVGAIWRKLNVGAQLQNFPCAVVQRMFLYSNAFKAKSCAQIPSFRSPFFTSVTDTHKQKLNILGCSGGGWNPSPIELGVVIEDFEHVLLLPKLLGSNV